MLNPNEEMLRQKTISADEAVLEIKDGQRIYYSEFSLFPCMTDTALAKRCKSLKDLVIESVCFTKRPLCADLNKNIRFEDWHFGGVSRRLFREKKVSYIPLTYHEGPRMIRKYKEYDHIFLCATPMGPRGNFNFGISNSLSSAVIDKAKRIVIETNPEIPYAMGGNQETIHISRVDAVIQTSGYPLPELSPQEASPEEKIIAEYILEEIEDGATLQLGIGALPNFIGKRLLHSTLKNLGIHTEMLVDAFADLYEAGIITGVNKIIDKGKMAYTFALGSKRLYDFIDRNPNCASYPVNYINDPKIIALNPKFTAVNNALEVDLFSQVSSESLGFSHISGTGGQLDFITGAFHSKGGKGIIALKSTYKDSQGNLKSRIVPYFQPGTVTTLPRTLVHHVVTEYGMARLKGRSVKERAKELIKIAHPGFRDQLEFEAKNMGIL